MKKLNFLIGTIASLFLAAAMTFSGLGFAPVFADNDDVSSSLLLPSSYEQYLKLDNPTSIAHSDEYFAVSDGNKIYIYDRAFGVYKTYEHEYNSDVRLNYVSQVGFSDGKTLYFSDSSTYLFSLNCSTLASSRTAITCSTFTIYKDYIYFSTVVSGNVTIAATTISNLDSAKAQTLDYLSAHATPSLCIDNGKVLYADSLYLNTHGSSDVIKLPTDPVLSMASDNGIMYICDTRGKLTIYDYNNAVVLNSYEGKYWYAEIYDGKVYVINGNEIEQIDLSSKKFTDYRICASSSANDRINGATDAVLADKKLVIADKGNDRITVYDTQSGNFSSFDTTYSPDSVSADSSTVLVLSGTSCTLYDYNGKTLFSYSELTGGEVFRSATNVFGTYYAVTSNNHFCKIYKDENGEYTAEKASKTLSSVAKLVTSDLYGNLYVYCADNSVYKFEEDYVMQTNAGGSYKYKFSAAISSFLCDYSGTVYGVYGNVLQSERTDYNVFKADCVYQPDNEPVKVVFGFDSPLIYGIYSNYITVTKGINIPCLNDIPVDDADEEIFRVQNAVLNVVNVKSSSVIIKFDLNKLEGADTFSYDGYIRTEKERLAIKLGETEDYYIVAMFDDSSKNYFSGITLKEFCSTTDSSEFLRDIDGFENGKAYAVNSVGLFKYPYITDALVLERLTKKDEVTVHGELTLNAGSEYNYCYVSVVRNGVTYTGYVPTAYLIPVEDTSGNKEIISYGYLSTDKKQIVMEAEDGTVKEISADNRFYIYGDPYENEQTKIGYTDSDGKTYYATVDSELIKSTNTKQLRNFAIIVIAVLALIIITDYFILRGKDDTFEEDI